MSSVETDAPTVREADSHAVTVLTSVRVVTVLVITMAKKALRLQKDSSVADTAVVRTITVRVADTTADVRVDIIMVVRAVIAVRADTDRKTVKREEDLHTDTIVRVDIIMAVRAVMVARVVTTADRRLTPERYVSITRKQTSIRMIQYV